MKNERDVWFLSKSAHPESGDIVIVKRSLIESLMYSDLHYRVMLRKVEDPVSFSVINALDRISTSDPQKSPNH